MCRVSRCIFLQAHSSGFGARSTYRCIFPQATSHSAVEGHHVYHCICGILVGKAWAAWFAEDLVLAATGLVFQDHNRKPRMPHSSGSLSFHMLLRKRAVLPDYIACVEACQLLIINLI